MLSQETKDALKSALIKLGISVPAKPVVKLEDVALIDGTMLSVDKMEAGAAATFTGADGVAIPAEGEFELADGSTVICAGGLITEIKPKEADIQPEVSEVPAPNAEMAAILSRLEAIEKRYTDSQTTLEAQLSKQNEGLIVALSTIEKMNENAVAMSLESQKPKPVSQVEFSKLTEYQKYQLAKHGEIKY